MEQDFLRIVDMTGPWFGLVVFTVTSFIVGMYKKDAEHISMTIFGVIVGLMMIGVVYLNSVKVPYSCNADRTVCTIVSKGK